MQWFSTLFSYSLSKQVFIKQVFSYSFFTKSLDIQLPSTGVNLLVLDWIYSFLVLAKNMQVHAIASLKSLSSYFCYTVTRSIAKILFDN